MIKVSLDAVKTEDVALGSTDQIAKSRSLLDAVKAQLEVMPNQAVRRMGAA